MSDMLIPAVIAVGGGVYVLATQAPTSPIPYPVAGGTTYVPPTNIANSLGLSQVSDPGTAAKVDALLQAGEAKFNAMSDAERAQAANYLNQQLNIQPPMSGNETWQQVASIAGGATGGAVCSMIPGIGTAASPLCAMAGAYLGVSLESWLAGSLDSIKSWINQNVPGVVTDWIDQAEASLSDWFHSIF